MLSLYIVICKAHESSYSYSEKVIRVKKLQLKPEQ